MKPSRARYGVVGLAIGLAGPLLRATRCDIPGGRANLPRSPPQQSTDGIGLRRFWSLLRALRDSHRSARRPHRRSSRAVTDRGRVVDLHSSHRSSLERRLALRHSLSLRSRRSRLFPQSHPHAQRLAARARTSHRSGAYVGLHALGRSGNSAAGADLHPPLWLAMGLRRFRGPRPGLVRHLFSLVQRRSREARIRQRRRTTDCSRLHAR